MSTSWRTALLNHSGTQPIPSHNLTTGISIQTPLLLKQTTNRSHPSICQLLSSSYVLLSLSSAQQNGEYLDHVLHLSLWIKVLFSPIDHFLFVFCRPLVAVFSMHAVLCSTLVQNWHTLSCYSCTVAVQFSHTAGASCQRTYCNEAPLEAKSVKTPASLQEHTLTWIKYSMYSLTEYIYTEFVSAKNRETLQPFWQQAVGRSLCCRRCFSFPFHSCKIHSYKLL